MVLTLTGDLSKPDDSDIRHRQPDTTAYLKSNQLGKGTLFIAESRLSWLADDGQGFELDYPTISLHAVSRDLDNFPAECLYLMLNSSDNGEEQADSEQDEEEDDLNELRFVPDAKNSLDTMFKALSDCQLLHPDPTDDLSEEDEEGLDDGGDEYDVAAAELVLGVADGNGDVGSDGEEMDVVPGQFDDAPDQ